MAHCYWKYYGDGRCFRCSEKVKHRSRDHKSDYQRLSFFVARASVSSTLPAAKLTFSSLLSSPSVSLQKAFLKAHRGSGSTVGSDYVQKFERDGLLLRIVLEGAKGWPFFTRQVLVLIVLGQHEQSPSRSPFYILSGFWPSSFFFCGIIAILAMKSRSA
jgi:hypothetical protein